MWGGAQVDWIRSEERGNYRVWRKVPQNAKVDLRVQNLAQTQLSHGSYTWYKSRSITPELG